MPKRLLCNMLHKIPPKILRIYWHKDCRKHFTVTTKACMACDETTAAELGLRDLFGYDGPKGHLCDATLEGVGCQYRTAWHMLHRIREACGRGEFLLRHVVEADEIYIGGKRKNMSNAKRKALADTGWGAVGKVTASLVEATDAATLIGNINSIVEPRTTVYTDEASAYTPLEQHHHHESAKHSISEYVRETVHVNGMESVWAS